MPPSTARALATQRIAQRLGTWVVLRTGRWPGATQNTSTPHMPQVRALPERKHTSAVPRMWGLPRNMQPQPIRHKPALHMLPLVLHMSAVPLRMSLEQRRNSRRELRKSAAPLRKTQLQLHTSAVQLHTLAEQHRMSAVQHHTSAVQFHTPMVSL